MIVLYFYIDLNVIYHSTGLDSFLMCLIVNAFLWITCLEFLMYSSSIKLLSFMSWL